MDTDIVQDTAGQNDFAACVWRRLQTAAGLVYAPKSHFSHTIRMLDCISCVTMGLIVMFVSLAQRSLVTLGHQVCIIQLYYTDTAVLALY